ncbi:unnamed protein product [Spirodela intermedia]|uniref:Uncharacterized protein n=1 Tax=Spirodela intermedia TaxID=51605 RepID=A0A7I8LFY6_SPIIN|nr:unnamed protein product [Spirodela intermedia]
MVGAVKNPRAGPHHDDDSGSGGPYPVLAAVYSFTVANEIRGDRDEPSPPRAAATFAAKSIIAATTTSADSMDVAVIVVEAILTHRRVWSAARRRPDPPKPPTLAAGPFSPTDRVRLRRSKIMHNAV